MVRTIKKLSLVPVILAIAFLLIQVLCDLFIPTLTANMVNNGIVAGNVNYIWQQGVIMLLVSLAGFASALLNTNISAKIAYKLGCNLRKEIYRKTTQFSNDEFDSIGTSSLITRNTNDVTQVQNLIEMLLKFLILAPLYLVGGVYMSYRLSPSLSSVFVIVIPFVAIVSIGISLFSNPLFAKMQAKVDKLNLIFREGLNGVKVIRAFNKSEYEYNRYEDTNKEYTKVSIRVNAAIGLMMPLMTLIMSLATIAVTWIGGKGVSGGTVEVGTIMGVISYSMQILTGFMLITNVISAVPRGMTSAKRIYAVLDMPIAVQDAKTPTPFESTSSSLALDNISYRYKGAEKDALRQISLSVERGQTLAIIGGTGAGKTTLTNLLVRLYDPTTGTILVNGSDIKRVSQYALHEKISIATQKAVLFWGTIRENMLLAKPDAADDEIWAALDVADATEFVRSMDGGLDALVEKGGGNFSGGQKQRLCIARALLKKAAVYVFDDSFSALDFKTDAQIRGAMKQRLADSITVIVAQRISTIVDADVIAVLNEGQLVGLGTHEQLKENNKVYQEIIISQQEKGAAA